jgi:hypothetical protein
LAVVGVVAHNRKKSVDFFLDRIGTIDHARAVWQAKKSNNKNLPLNPGGRNV